MSAASARDLALDIAGRIRTVGPISVSRFFGGAGLVAASVQFGFVIKGTLYLRVDKKTRSTFEALGAAPFTYAGSVKTVTVTAYYEAPSEVVEDPDTLGQWVVDAHRAALAMKSSRKATTPK
jgi:TfoX/Sxy family transcriptional regulator of competence genes